MTDWDPRETIAAKRERRPLPPADVERFVLAYAAEEIGDGPAAAFLMAALLNGLNESETLAMTRAMIASGETVTFGDLGHPTVDKHSTGGVADGVTLVFAPLAAALGLAVAKLSGRALGHTGGTLDKLESIPGLRTDLEPDRIARQVREVGCAVAAQSSRLVPADGALYALRDATATVESVPLIASSILSKKLAEGIDALVLDVKVGRGAFMKTLDDARLLARTMVDLCKSVGRDCVALLTRMDAPLGRAVGNAVEVAESIEVLSGGGPADVRELTVLLGAEMLLLGGVSGGRERLEKALGDGSARRRFAELIEAQGGDARVVDDPGRLPHPRHRKEVLARRSGVVTALDAELVGLAAVDLGAGRARKEDPVDPAAGLLLRRRVGESVRAGDALAELHAATESRLEAGEARFSAAVTIGDAAPPGQPLVLERIA